MEKKKILYYNSTLLKGGTESYILSLIENIDKSKFSCDLLIKNGDVFDENNFYRFKDSNCNIFLAKGNFFKRIIFLKKFFANHRGYYDVCHINATSKANGLIAFFAAKYGKIKKIIFHSHMSGNDNKSTFVDTIGAKFIKKYCTDFVACSQLAYDFMYGEKFKLSHKPIILKNAVDINKFCYNEKLREKYRKKLKLKDDEFTIIHIGRFVPQKNHMFLIDIFKDILNQKPNAKLVLIGFGPLFEDVKNYADSLNISNNILFLGIQNDVYCYFQAADCFVMTSIHEGLPIVAVEAQSVGLPCILSSNISKETKLTKNVKFVDLNNGTDKWASSILSVDPKKRKSCHETIKKVGFDTVSAAKVVEKMYLAE